MITQENKVKGLLWIITGAICIYLCVSFFNGLQKNNDLSVQIDRQISRINVLERMDDPSDVNDLFIEADSPSPEYQPSDWVFQGLGFFEFMEIDRFVMEKIRVVSQSIKLHPPKNLYVTPIDKGVKLVWSANPLNQDTIKKLEDNPLLQLHYKIYRWTKESRPGVVAVLTSQERQYVDSNISPAREAYYYCLLLVLEGATEESSILIESEKSEVVSVSTNDRFTIRLLSGNEKTVSLSITITVNGKSYTESFEASVGQTLGGPKEVPGMGTIDFSTALSLSAIRFGARDEIKTTKIPVFNSDGSVTIELTTGEPAYRESAESRPVRFLLIECKDKNGQIRVFEES